MKYVKWAALALACLGMASWYLSHAYLLPQSEVSFHARLMTTSPFVYRLLIPYTLGLLLPLGWLDAGWLKMLFAWGSLMAFLALMPAFTERVTGWRPTGWRLGLLWGLCLALVGAHYALPRPFMFYYIYDLPAVPLYMLCFLALTRSAQTVTWGTLALVWLAALNRETVVLALCQAAAWHYSCATGAPRARLQALAGFGRGCALALGLIVLTRWGLNAWIQPQGDGNVAWMEGEHVRVYANLYRMAVEPFHLRPVFFFGLGAVAWLPWAWRGLTPQLKALGWGALPNLALLLVAGNMVELRIYSEFMPALAVLALVFLLGLSKGRAALQGAS